MKSQEMPRLLIISASNWIENTSSGNTFSNMFNCWDKDKIAMVYTKSDLPQNDICYKYFRMSETQVMKSYFDKNISIGEEIDLRKLKNDKFLKSDVAIEDKVKNSSLKKFFYNVLLLGREIMWCCSKWKTKELDDFLNDYRPEVIFACGYGSAFMNKIERYIIQKSGAKAAFFIGDDWYSLRQINLSPFFWIMRLWNRREVRKTVKECDLFYTMAPKVKEQFDKYLKINSKILAKSGTFDKLVQTELNKPLKLVYTGNLFCGRWKSLARIARSLEQINKNGKKAELYIYSIEKLTNKQKKVLEIENTSYFMGGISVQEVKNVQNEADILVFVEAMDLKDRYISWLSFSTKIVDYLEKGKCIFAIGWEQSSPIDYLIKNEAAVVATNRQEISTKLEMLVNNEKLISEFGKKAFETGKKNHSKNIVDAKMIEDLRILGES